MGEFLIPGLPRALTALFFLDFIRKSVPRPTDGAGGRGGAMMGASKSISTGELLDCVL